jgi:hypothetical protein
MSDLKTEDNDLIFENNDLIIVTGQQETKQRLEQRLQTFLGEWFLDTSIGVPYYQDILKKNPDTTLVTGTLKSVITQTPGVTDLLEFNFTFNKQAREATLVFTARSASGDIGLEVTI